MEKEEGKAGENKIKTALSLRPGEKGEGKKDTSHKTTVRKQQTKPSLHIRHPPSQERTHQEDVVGMRQIQGHTTGLEANK